MRLVRLVIAGIVLGAVAGYVSALLRPRTVHRNPAGDLAGAEPAPLPERVPAAEIVALPETAEVGC
jgi:hypothetical protein